MAANVHPIKPLKAFNGDAVPERLKGIKAWVAYSLYNRDGRPGKTDKRPVSADGVPLREWNTPAQLLTYEQALQRLQDLPNAAGLGFCMRGQVALTGVDLDNAIKDGVLQPWAQEIVDALGSYTERSPSGKGVRIFTEAETVRDWQTRMPDGVANLEVYGGHGKQFLTVTGDRLPGTAPGVNPSPAGLGMIEARYRREPSATAANTPMPDPVEAPAIEALDLPAYASEFLLNGETGADRSKTLQATARALCKHHDDATVLAVLSESTFAWGVALDHRRQDDDKAMEYLWKHTRDARAAVGQFTRNDVASLFDDLGPAEPHGEPLAEPMRGFEPVEYTHVHVLPVGVVLIAGGHGAGKTSLLVPLASMATGELDGAPHGLPVDLHRHVIYFTEDPSQAHRIRAGLRMHCDLNDNGLFHIQQAKRRSAAQVKVLVEAIVEKYTVTHPSGYRIRPLIAFDTINACFELENENDASQVGQIMSALKTAGAGCAIWLVGHLPKALLMKDVSELTARGSGAWEADAQCTAFIVADDAPDSNVRYLVTKKRRFETDITEVRFETATGTVTVAQPWGGAQTLTYRYGVPGKALLSRKQEKELRKDTAAQQAFAEDVEILTEYILNKIDRDGEVWMQRKAPGANPMPPAEATGKTLNWATLYEESGVVKPKAPKALQEALKAQFEPFDGWGRMVPKGVWGLA